jgi:hypothetical protein
MTPKNINLAIAINVCRSDDLPSRARWLVNDSGRPGHGRAIHEPNCNPSGCALPENVPLTVAVKITRADDFPG